MSGKREFFIKDRTIVIDVGDVVVISPNVLHRTTNTELPAHERLVINIHEEHLIRFSDSCLDILRPLLEKDYVIIRGFRFDQTSMEKLVGTIIEEIHAGKSGFELYVQALAVQLLTLCCRQMEFEISETPEFPSPMHERISDIVRFINVHYMEKLSLRLLAEKFYVSPYYLSRFFKEATGFTFVEYLNSIRVKEAKKLLIQSSLKVNLIAKKVGFGSVTHFGRVFKLVTGHSPLYFRAMK